MTQFSVSCPLYPDFQVELTKEELKTAPYDYLKAKIISVAGERINTPYSLEAYELNFQGTAPYHFDWRELVDDKGMHDFLERMGLDKVEGYPGRLRIVPQEPKSFVESASIHLEEYSDGMKKVTPESGMERMRKNLKKAIEEHIKFHFLDTKQAYPLDLKLQQTLATGSGASLPKTGPVAVSTASACSQGKRASMEDAHFSVDIEQGHLAGVFDGHCGDRMANVVAEYFPYVFEKAMRLSDNDVYLSFNITCKAINESFVNVFEEGSTAIVSFIDYENGLIYTAALGDSEARIYRKHQKGNGTEEIWSSIPISNVRDWTSMSDCKRGSKAYIAAKGKAIMKRLTGLISPNVPAAVRQSFARLDYPLFNSPGPNVSRAFGDEPFRYIYNPETEKAVEVVSVKPKITVCPLKHGDRVILACDGLFNSMPEEQILNIVKTSGAQLSEDANGGVVKTGLEARNLVNEAITRFHADDNVTVVALRVLSRNGGRQKAAIARDEQQLVQQGKVSVEAFNKAVETGASIFYTQVLRNDPKGLGLELQDTFCEWMEDFREGRTADWEVDRDVRKTAADWFKVLKSRSLKDVCGEFALQADEPVHNWSPSDEYAAEGMNPVLHASKQTKQDTIRIHSPKPRKTSEGYDLDGPKPHKSAKTIEGVASYLKGLEKQGYDIERMNPNENSLYSAIVLWMKKYYRESEQLASSVGELRELVHLSIFSQADKYKEEIRAFILHDIWGTLKEKGPGLVRIPEGMGEYLEERSVGFLLGDEKTQSSIDREVSEWIDREGVALYIEGIKQNQTTGGLIEAKAVSTFYGLPIVIHKIEDEAEGCTIALGEDGAEGKQTLHLLQYHHHFDLLLSPSDLSSHH